MDAATDAPRIPSGFGVIWSAAHRRPVVYEVLASGSGTEIRARALGEDYFAPIAPELYEAIKADLLRQRS